MSMTDEERAHRCFEDWGIRDEPLQIRFAKAIGEARAEGFRAGVEAARHAVATASAELYPDKTTEEDQIKAAIEMGAVGASGYFHERALMTALTWHIAAIDALTPPQESA